MAAVEITITGLLYDKLARTTQNVVLIGEATLSGLSVGGGPIIPPPSGGQPPVGAPPHPSHPIYPGEVPTHPIVLPPDEGTKPPEPVQPPIEWKAIWHPTEGWMIVGIPNVPHPAPSA